MWKKQISLKYILLVLLLLSVFVLYFVNSASSIYFPMQVRMFNKSKTNFSTVNDLAQGFQSYKGLTNSSKSFKIIQVDIDPFDVKNGKIQTVTVYVEDTKNDSITEENKVEIIVHQDNISTPFSLEFKEVKGSTSTVTKWQGFWECKDTHDSKYVMTITAKSANDSHSVDLTFR